MLTDPNALLMLALVLVSGVAFGHLATRLHVPAVTGQILVGIVIGPSVLNLFQHDAPERLQPITHFALGLIAVAVGNHLNVRRLRNAAKRLVILLALETTLTPLLVLAMILALPDADGTIALLLAAASISTAPATVVALVKEARARGVYVKTLVAAVALNNIACICIFEVAHAAASASLAPGGAARPLDILLAPLFQVAASAALGGLAGTTLLVATRHVYRSDRLATASVAAILLTSGLADYFGISSLLACLFLGVTLANLRPDRDEVGHRVFDDFESGILAAFFTLAGMELEFRYLVPAGILALVVVGARLIGKIGSAYIAMRLAGSTERVRRYLGMGLVPQAGVAVGLMLLVQGDTALEPVSDLFLAVGLTSVTINEIIGPFLTRLGLRRSGEAGRDRARLIDFIHEEHIATHFRAKTKEEAIERLTDLLIQTHHLRTDRERLVRSILRREEEGSTCVGGGLAIPHGELEEGARLAGVMALSEKGLDFETPDGRPVHCMVLLATPPDERDRHLEVLAVLARVVGADPVIQQELFGAESAAHAFEVLHAEESEGFNPFIDDD